MEGRGWGEGDDKEINKEQKKGRKLTILDFERSSEKLIEPRLFTAKVELFWYCS